MIHVGVTDDILRYSATQLIDKLHDSPETYHEFIVFNGGIDKMKHRNNIRNPGTRGDGESLDESLLPKYRQLMQKELSDYDDCWPGAPIMVKIRGMRRSASLTQVAEVVVFDSVRFSELCSCISSRYHLKLLR